MTKDEWLALSDSARWGIMFNLAHVKLSAMPAPTGTATRPEAPPAARSEVPDAQVRPPRFDVRIPRRDGYQWASETLLESLEWWHSRKLERAAEGGHYADKDRKLAAELERFIEWRRVAAGARWSGVRGEQSITAQPPTRDPEIHAWEERR
jgi:hypothetical protein